MAKKSLKYVNILDANVVADHALLWVILTYVAFVLENLRIKDKFQELKSLVGRKMEGGYLW